MCKKKNTPKYIEIKNVETQSPQIEFMKYKRARIESSLELCSFTNEPFKIYCTETVEIWMIQRWLNISKHKNVNHYTKLEARFGVMLLRIRSQFHSSTYAECISLLRVSPYYVYLNKFSIGSILYGIYSTIRG